MGRFIFWFAIFVLIGGISLHYKFDLPYFLTWIGKLPGDMIISKGRTLYYFPITSASAASFVFTVIFSRSKKK